jgi:hypothetical protein
MKITKRADQCPLVALRVISLQSSFGRFPRWHQTLKNRILLDNYYLPGDDPHCAGGWLVSPDLTGRSFIPKR